MNRELQGGRKRVVIVGGGFGGLNAARKLSALPVEVTLIDRRNFHLFQPLLYQVATGGLSPGDIAAPLRSILSRQKNVTVLLEEVSSIDPHRRALQLSKGELEYDFLVLATGAENHYFGNDHWAAFAPSLKTIEDATAIRSRILAAFEKAENESDEEIRRQHLRFVVVGGGPTGVELAGSIGEIARDTLRGDFRRIKPEEAQVLLLEYGPRILSSFEPALSDKAVRSLIGLGVLTRTGVKVVNIEEGALTVATRAGEEKIRASTILWAAGVRASPLARQLGEALGVEVDSGGRIRVEADLSVAGAPEVFVIGDAAWCEQGGKRLPGMCPVAMQQGWHLAKAVEARLRGIAAPPFRFRDKGTMATIGRKAAVADLGFVRFGGWLAWVVWLFLHLLYLVTFRRRVIVAIQWAFQYVTFNRGARLIERRSSKL